jgi:hypothetical protein
MYYIIEFMSNAPNSKSTNDSPDITRTEFGREVVNVMAHGCLQYMQDHKIPITPEGFQELVQVSIDKDLNGRIAFQMYPFTQMRLQQLFSAQTGISPMKLSEGGLDKLRKKPSLRNRLLSLGIAPDSQQLPAVEKEVIIDRVKRHMGEDVGDVIDALIRGDCRRELVWERMKEIQKDGDIQLSIRQYREKWNLVLEE